MVVASTRGDNGFFVKEGESEGGRGGGRKGRKKV